MFIVTNLIRLLYRTLSTLFLFLSLLAPPGAFADQSCDQGATVGASASVSDYNSTDSISNLADYGLIFQDAAHDTSSAAWDAAHAALLRKINSTLVAGSRHDAVVLKKTVGPYQGWLEGANVSLIMASGLLLADHQKLSPALDSAIRRVIGSYVFNRDASCGLSDGRWRSQNSCMDDYMIAATGFAWIAAYKYKRGDNSSGVAYYVDAAKNSINLALSLEESVCAYRTGST